MDGLSQVLIALSLLISSVSGLIALFVKRDTSTTKHAMEEVAAHANNRRRGDYDNPLDSIPPDGLS